MTYNVYNLTCILYMYMSYIILLFIIHINKVIIHVRGTTLLYQKTHKKLFEINVVWNRKIWIKRCMRFRIFLHHSVQQILFFCCFLSLVIHVSVSNSKDRGSSIKLVDNEIRVVA